MDSCQENVTHKGEFHKGAHALWNMMPEHSFKEQNVLTMNKKFMAIIIERDTAIQERNLALTEKKAALAERDLAFLQRDAAIEERNSALLQRDNVIAALQYHKNEIKVKRKHPPATQLVNVAKAPHASREADFTDAFPLSVIALNTVKPHHAKQPKSPKPLQKGKDLNRNAVPFGTKTKNEWDHDLGLILVTFDDSTMPAPVCSCTGVFRQCYRWGNGGWQSSCCTTTLSAYPLPALPHKRHARMGGRKMSGSVFTRLLSRLAARGHDLSIALDLKDHWARHGTNRYITIK